MANSLRTRISKGAKVEREHKSTYDRIKRQKRLPPAKEFYESIAKDHIQEDKDYYKKLKKAGL